MASAKTLSIGANIGSLLAKIGNSAVSIAANMQRKINQQNDELAYQRGSDNVYGLYDFAPDYLSEEEKYQYMANLANAKTFAFNRDEAQKARNWSEYMSSSAHQREVADLRKAGLNPVLSANTGATSYSTVAGSGAASSSAQALSAIQSAHENRAAAKYSADMSKVVAEINQKTQKYTADKALAASKQNAKAIRYSADKSAAASAYAADRHAAATQYAADRSYASVVYSTDYAKNGSFAGIFDKWISQFVNDEGAAKKLKDAANEAIGQVPILRLFNKDKTKLSEFGRVKLNMILRRIGYDINKGSNEALVVAMLKGDESAAAKIAKSAN